MHQVSSCSLMPVSLMGGDLDWWFQDNVWASKVVCSGLVISGGMCLLLQRYYIGLARPGELPKIYGLVCAIEECRSVRMELLAGIMIIYKLV